MEYQVEDLRSEISIIEKTDHIALHILASKTTPESFIHTCESLGIHVEVLRDPRQKLTVPVSQIVVGVICNKDELDTMREVLGEDKIIISYEYNDYDSIDTLIDAYYYNLQS